MTKPGQLLAALDRFIERAGAAQQKGRQAKVARQYAQILKKRFQAQRDWFVDHALPLLKHRIAESRDIAGWFREANDSDETIAAHLSGLLDQWLDDPETRAQLDKLVKLAQAAGVDYIEAQMAAEDLALALAKLIQGGSAIQFGLDNPRAIEWLSEHAFEKISFGLDQTTRDRVGSTILEGLTDKQSYSAIAKAIRDEFDGFSTYRSEMIATHEIGNAYVQGILAGAEDLAEAGIDMEKSWLTAGDDLVEEECQSNEDAGWIDLDEDFPSGDEAPLAHPNCRCALSVRKLRSEVLLLFADDRLTRQDGVALRGRR